MSKSKNLMSFVPVALLLLLLVAAASTQDAASYWPQWRGPTMTGVSPNGDPPIEWSEELNVAWKVEIPGRGNGTPVIWGDHVFVLSAIETDATDPQATPQPAPDLDAPSHVPAMSEGGVGGDAPDLLAAGDAAEPERAQRPGQRGQRGRRGPAGPLPVYEFVVMALDRSDGSVAWQHTAKVERPHDTKRDNNTYASASAITDGEHVIAYFGSRGLFAYDMEGNLHWQTDLGDMRIRNSFGEGATPALHANTVVVTWDHQGPSFIVALDKRTGEELWRQERDEIDTWATPLIVEFGGTTQVVTAGTNQVRSYDLETGELLWDGSGLTYNPIPSPVAADGIVYLTAGYRGNALRAVRLADASGNIDGSDAVLWQYNQDTPYVPSPLLYGSNLYMIKSNNAILTNMNPETGTPHYGPLRLEGLSELYASPVGAAGRVYLVGRDGNMLVIENGPEFNVLASNSLDDGFDASPAVVDQEMYLRGYRYLYRISED